MMKIVQSALALVVAAAIAQPLLAGPPKEKKAARDAFAARLKLLEGLSLTADQKAKIEDLKKGYGPKFATAEKNVASVYTPEQQKARHEAAKAAKAAGKKGKDLRQAVESAANLTADQKPKLAGAQKALGSLSKEFQAKVWSVLTPEQRDQLRNAYKAKKAGN
jgi:Spy/CpxP family protein refolding chaperone